MEEEEEGAERGGGIGIRDGERGSGGGGGGVKAPHLTSIIREREREAEKNN